MVPTEEQKREAFKASVAKTFSEMAFLDAEPIGELESELEYSHIVHITFSEPNAGEIALFLPLPVKQDIVENIYGEDWESMKATEIDDCLLEMLNVLAGDFLSDLYGAGAHRDLSLPDLLFDESELSKADEFETYCFDAEGNQFKAELRLV